jgi:CTP synthase
VRADREIPAEERRKLSLFCNVRPSAVIQALDVPSIYDVPIAYHKEGLDDRSPGRLRHRRAPAPRMDMWEEVVRTHHNPKARSPSPSSASTPACWTPTSR